MDIENNVKSTLRKLHFSIFNPIITAIGSVLDVKFERILSEIEANRVLIVQERIREFSGLHLEKIAESEFRVFSQWGEDGIIQYLLSKVPISNKVFIEFGIEDYRESNTRFLLMNNNWSGLVIDSDSQNISKIKLSNLYWRNDLTAECEFITRENINSVIEKAGLHGDIGLLSIDIDGNDYWIWDAIHIISPRIVVIEYNNLLGKERAVTIPYRPDFDRAKAHYSNLYYGASLRAMCKLAQKKKYVFAGSNSAGSNGFFVREDVAEDIDGISCEEGFIESKVREARDFNGSLLFPTKEKRNELIKDMFVLDLDSDQLILLTDVLE